MSGLWTITGMNRGKSVPQYRIYHLDGIGRVSSTEWLDADGDKAAIAAARNHGTAQCELWQGRRLVTRLAAKNEDLSPVPARDSLSRPGAAPQT